MTLRIAECGLRIGLRITAGLALLASLTLAGAVTGCVPPAPLSVSGMLPPPTSTFSIVGEEDVAPPVRTSLIDALAGHGLRYTSERPDRLVVLTLADRPRTSGTVAGTVVPTPRSTSGWIDRPVKDGWFSKGRREVRLTIRFLSPDGRLREERVAHEIVTHKAPPADMLRLIAAALRP